MSNSFFYVAFFGVCAVYAPTEGVVSAASGSGSFMENVVSPALSFEEDVMLRINMLHQRTESLTNLELQCERIKLVLESQSFTSIEEESDRIVNINWQNERLGNLGRKNRQLRGEIRDLRAMIEYVKNKEHTMEAYELEEEIKDLRGIIEYTKDQECTIESLQLAWPFAVDQFIGNPIDIIIDPREVVGLDPREVVGLDPREVDALAQDRDNLFRLRRLYKRRLDEATRDKDIRLIVIYKKNLDVLNGHLNQNTM